MGDLDWLKLLESFGSLGLLIYMFANYLPNREKFEREERAALALAFEENNKRLITYCQTECNQFRDDSQRERQQYTDTLLKMLEKQNENAGN